MSIALSPQEFVAKWRQTELRERASAQEHFLDLCRLVGHPTPAEDDPAGERFAFEAGASKQGGGQGWADVWKKGFFAWEYKGKHKNLDKAYEQLLLYRESLQNPALLVVCDIERVVIHTNFTNTAKQVVTLALDDLLTAAGLAQLRAVFYEPERFRSLETSASVTEKVAAEFAQLADRLRLAGHPAPQVAHFLIRLLFCLFAEDVDLLPDHLFTRLVHAARLKPQVFSQQLRQLFAAMAGGGWFGVESILHFNGGLFDDDAVLELDAGALAILDRVTTYDWSIIEPSIFGTLFTRSLDPSKRAQLGAHYTSREDILLIVEPGLMAPLRRRWAEVEAEARALAARRDAAKDKGERTKLGKQLSDLLVDFAAELASVRVLDPACGSGNFLYVALALLLDLWKQVYNLMLELGLTALSPLEAPSPAQLHGIEIDPYAHDLAQTTIWIGYIQWFREHGFGVPSEPILKEIETVRLMDAILAYDAGGRPIEPAWPEADIIVGNPPFLGDKKMRGELGDKYVDDLRRLYANRIPGQSDLVCYWFEIARGLIERGKVRGTGLLATNSIRYGENRHILERIKETGAIFMAWSDRPWVLEGASVRVSMVGFDHGKESNIVLDGRAVTTINADLTANVDVTKAVPLLENVNLAFLGMMKSGPFNIDSATARAMLNEPLNPNGRPNSDVVKPRLGGLDVVRLPRREWIIDFGANISEEVAALYEAPFEYVRNHVLPFRQENRRAKTREAWWLFGETRPGLRSAMANLRRCIVTPEVSKHRVFIWMPTDTIPDHTLHVIARDDDYFFGLLQSRPHLVWALELGNQLEDRPRYNSSRIISTYPFPWPPGQEPLGDPRLLAIAEAARELADKREAWLNPPGASEAELKARTLTNLYNQRPAWLHQLHERLDQAVLAAYGWPEGLSDEEVLGRLLALNGERGG